LSKGFTLLELMVVIALLSVLVSLFFSSLSQAKSAARSVVCKNNLRQQGLALAIYVGDFHRYPLGEDSRVKSDGVAVGAEVARLGSWARLLSPYVPSQSLGVPMRRTFACPETETVSLAALKGSVGASASSSSRMVEVNGYYGYNGYGTAINLPWLNLGLGRAWDEDTVDEIAEVTESSIKTPSEMIAIADSSGVSSLVSPVVARASVSDLGFFLPGRRHAHGANVAHCDGHVSFHRLRSIAAATSEARRRWNNDYEPHPETW
jgi:prepilin-type N-terminal cleavage/methylation domain-containing protein/prepilin-type processing-associated H-X9-DG protein